MSFWDTVGGLFTGDTYFPGNPNREARAKELARDCQNYIANLATLTATIKNELRTLNGQLADLYGSSTAIPADAQTTNVDFENMPFEVSQLLLPLVTAPAVSFALTLGATSFLLSTGEIGAAGLVGLVGLPAAFEVAIGAVAGVAAIGIVLAVGAIEGAVKRDNLRSTIHQGVTSRAKLAKAYLVDSQLESSIHAMISALQALQAAGVETPQVMENLKTMVAAARAHIDATTDETTAAMLLNLDISRSSWTNEDT